MDTKDALSTAADYVRRQRTKGKSEQEIEAKLRAAGWNDRTLNALWQQMEAQDASASAAETPAPARQTPAPKAAPASAARTPAPARDAASASAELFTNPTDGYEMALIPAGKAIFGSADDDPDAYDDEKPQFEAELEGFYLGLYCVSNRQYAAFLNAVQPANGELGKWITLSGSWVVRGYSGYEVENDDPYGDHPVVRVSWYGAQAYCEWSGLRLPSELEWEKGCRGCYGEKYPWGDEWDENMCRNSSNKGSETTCVVWEYPEGVSRYGLYNISGNVREWCADWYDGDVYQRYAAGDLRPPESGGNRVLRGGSWDCGGPRVFRCAVRDGNVPGGRYDAYGFRCARGL